MAWGDCWQVIVFASASPCSTRWTVSGCPPILDGGGTHRWEDRGRSGGSGNVCSRGIHAHRQLQVEETHEQETSIPQVGWSWTIPRLDPILIHQYQLLSNLIDVIGESHIQSQKKAEIKNPCKHWVSRLVFERKTNQPDLSTLISAQRSSMF